MFEVVLMRGITGSGKSSHAKGLHPTTWCSADKFFHNEEDEYVFDPTRLTEAHGSCLIEFIDAVQAGVGCNDDVLIVVDNTNIRAAELAPYIAVAQAYGANVGIVLCWCDPMVAATRNVHDVPAHVAFAQYQELLRESLPPWWPKQQVIFG
jgi:predicted kinase